MRVSLLLYFSISFIFSSSGINERGIIPQTKSSITSLLTLSKTLFWSLESGSLFYPYDSDQNDSLKVHLNPINQKKYTEYLNGRRRKKQSTFYY